MKRDFKEAVKNRRSIYGLDNKVAVSEKEIREIMEFVLLNVPSSFNSQSTRMVLLLADQHKRLWDITKDTLKLIVPADAFKATEDKIDGAFASGYGTILFFEDKSVVKGLEDTFPNYAHNFKGWSIQTSGMHQFAVWTMLEDAGLGASLQHYNPLIDEAVAKEWNIDPNWELISQMPFGNPVHRPGEKESQPLDKRLLVFK